MLLNAGPGVSRLRTGQSSSVCDWKFQLWGLVVVALMARVGCPPFVSQQICRADLGSQKHRHLRRRKLDAPQPTLRPGARNGSLDD